MAAETVIVARTGYRYPEKILIFVCGLDNRGECDEKNRVFLRLFSRIEQADAGIGRNRPVRMFTGAVDAISCLSATFLSISIVS